MKKLYTILLIMAVIFTACDDFLADKPEKSAQQEIETVRDIDLLLDETLNFDGGILNEVQCTYVSDDYTYYSDVYGVFASWIDYYKVQENVWADKLSVIDESAWSNAYKAIWKANYIINNIDGLEGGQEDKANLKAEAHLIKAYKYLGLTIKYCLYPSAANADEMGLPIKNSTEFGLNTVRATLAETVEQIANDITEGLKINRKRDKSWRDSDASAAALAARYYLYIHDFVNAKKYAEKALALHDRMINMETEVTERKKYGGLYDSPSTADKSRFSAPFYTAWESQYKLHYVDDYLFMPSANLLAMYQPEDLRLKKFYTQGYLAYYYGIQVNNNLYEKLGGATPTGTDVAEMYLILAECAARVEDYTTCMQNVEKVRINRFDTADYEVLPTPSSKKEAVQLIVDERRREFAFTPLRWYDIKRMNAEGLIDPITITREFYEMSDAAVDFSTPKTYTLEPNSRRYARPLPNEVINLTEGSVKQNEY